MTSPRIPAILITGATGAGKSTLLLHMLERRPRDARWAVLVNDFGATAVSSAVAGVALREVAGCVCCSAQVSLRTAVVTLLREARPERLLIEASSAAHPEAIAKVLREPGLAASVELQRVVCAVHPRHVVDARYAGNEVYREQLNAADEIILTHAEHVSAAELDAAHAALRLLGLACARVAGAER